LLSNSYTRYNKIIYFLGISHRPTKWQRLEADHSTPFSTEVKNGGAIPPLAYVPSWHGAESFFILPVFI
jgi:hypothetical protein